MNDFAGCTAVVSGGSGALGSVVVHRFLAAGAVVETIDRSAERARARFTDLDVGDRLHCHGADPADAESVAAVVAAIEDRRGAIDHLVCTVGGFSFDGPVETTPLDAFDRMFDANLRSTLHLCRAVVPGMKRRGAGTIVTVGSRASLAGGAEVAAYAVAKTAVLRLSESLAAEGKRHGVRVNCVLPGTMDTPANRAAMPDADASRWVPLEAMADVILFLSSSGARGIHGAAIPVFGVE